ncbi:hypothetical protein RSOLAG1IB_09805 [Rhizoctonia solani AG-1 IB]|uniref:Mannan endo-1,6-alpha-mannosidase n=1 Tax=Thanatephorus cucumeris (strain AG1-IB / isolate 7/3/14) TaxID=1108050 RepID=A0A0B7FY53_THACB|nr:hypothetical protein RSOLAG1IB_09805 [Rhizoctonia solani AG-1 IB]
MLSVSSISGIVLFLAAHSLGAAISPVTRAGPCAEAKTWANDYVAIEMNRYFAKNGNPGGCGCYPATQYVWHTVTALEGVVNYMMITGDDQYRDYVLTARDASAGSLLVPENFNESHDDALWTVLLYFKIDEWTTDGRYWDAGIRLLGWAGEGRSDSRSGSTAACDGGVWWEGAGTSKTGYKNAITNELFIVASTKAYLKTKNQSFLNDALTSWTFLKKRMRRGSTVSQPGLYSDGTQLPDCTNNMQETWTYNQGVVLHALGLLYKATGNRSYVDEALVTLDAVIKQKTKDKILTETCDLPGNTCNYDQVGFKGLFMRHLQYFLEVVNDSAITAKYSGWIGLQARAMNQHARRADGNVGSIWWGTSDVSLYPEAVNALSSGVDAILAANKFGTC